MSKIHIFIEMENGLKNRCFLLHPNALCRVEGFFTLAKPRVFSWPCLPSPRRTREWRLQDVPPSPWQRSASP